MDRAGCVAVLRKYVTVEPVIFMFMFSLSLLNPTVQAFVYWKVCMKKYLNQTICDNLTQPGFEEREDYVQSVTSHWFLASDFAFQIPSIVCSLLHGNISDHVSRRVALMLPLIGQILSCTSYVINAAVFELPVSFILIGPFFSGCFGGWIGCCLTAFSYLSDDCSEKSRTIRISLSEGVLNTAQALAYCVGGIFLDSTNFVAVLSTALCINTLGLAYTVFVIRDTTSEIQNEYCHDRTREKKRCTQKLRMAFSPAKIKEALAVTLKKRSLRRRVFILLVLGSSVLGALSFSPLHTGILYLYLKRQPLSWTQTVYGYYRAYKLIIDGVGLLIVLPLIKRFTRMRETSVMILTIVTTAVAEALLGVSRTTPMVFLVTLIGFMGACNTTCARSLLSMLVERDELGKIFAVFGSIQAVGGILTDLLYNNIYPLTLDYWAGLCFAIGGLLSVAPLTIVIYLHIGMKASDKYCTLQEEKPEDPDPEHCIETEDTPRPVTLHVRQHELGPEENAVF